MVKVRCSRGCAEPRRDPDHEHPGVCVCGGLLDDVCAIHGTPIELERVDGRYRAWCAACAEPRCDVHGPYTAMEAAALICGEWLPIPTGHVCAACQAVVAKGAQALADCIDEAVAAAAYRVCNQPVGRGTVGDNRRCGALCEPEWKLCAAHLALARETFSESELTRRFRYRFGTDAGDGRGV